MWRESTRKVVLFKVKSAPQCEKAVSLACRNGCGPGCTAGGRNPFGFGSEKQKKTGCIKNHIGKLLYLQNSNLPYPKSAPFPIFSDSKNDTTIYPVVQAQILRGISESSLFYNSHMQAISKSSSKSFDSTSETAWI